MPTYCTVTLVRQCPVLDSIPMGTLSSNDRFIGTHVTYTCLMGHHMLQGGAARSSICQDGGKWTVLPKECTGKFIL